MNIHGFENKLKKILSKIVNHSQGINCALITDDVGIIIAYQSDIRLSNLKKELFDKIGAIGSSIFSAVEEQGNMMGFKNLCLQKITYEKGIIFSYKIEKGFLILITDLSTLDELLRALFNIWEPIIKKILKDYFKKYKLTFELPLLN